MLKKLGGIVATSTADAATDAIGKQSDSSSQRPSSSARRRESLPAALSGLLRMQRRPYHVDVTPTVVRGADGKGQTPGHIQITPTRDEQTTHGLAPAYGHSPTKEATQDAVASEVKGRFAHPAGTPYNFGKQVFPKRALPFSADKPILRPSIGAKWGQTFTRLTGPALNAEQAAMLRDFKHSTQYSLNTPENCVGGFTAAANAILKPAEALEMTQGHVTPQHIAAEALRKIPDLKLDKGIGLGVAIGNAERDLGVKLTRGQQAHVLENLVTQEQFGKLDASIKQAIGDLPPGSLNKS
jgi:hypothetical protein